MALMRLPREADFVRYCSALAPEFRIPQRVARPAPDPISMPRNHPPGAPSFDRTFRLSRYVERVAGARPELIEEIERRGAKPYSREEMRAALAGDGAGLDLRLPRPRERGLGKLAHPR